MSDLIEQARASESIDTCRACGDGFIDKLADEIERLTAVKDAAQAVINPNNGMIETVRLEGVLAEALAAVDKP